ncbi:hypothetical protein FSP39_008938 [Pinctada imbricata]|uniref:RING-type domain-containing protein n=1 Tax=Pinctada imbricata TaxID=66713 RepID=A0AA89BT59_PINIB|nr:hypothetical protein FSP39_008938 [Pinctada imbricata]
MATGGEPESYAFPEKKKFSKWSPELADNLIEQNDEALCKALDEVWRESLGLPILFTWIDWLKNNALSHLGLSNHILLDESDPDDIIDTRAYSDCLDVMLTADQLLRYNQQQVDLIFQRDTHECPVCFIERLGRECVKFNECGHFFCLDCATDLCKHHVQEGSVTDLRCPEPKCETEIPPYVIQNLLGDEEFSRFEELALSGTCFDEEERQIAEEKEKERKDKEENTLKKKIEKAKRKQEEFQSRSFVKQFCKQCPSCDMDIMKDGGCNKVHCQYCNRSMCWSCGKDITAESYSHFEASTRCQGFDPYLGDNNLIRVAPPPLVRRPPVSSRASTVANVEENELRSEANEQSCHILVCSHEVFLGAIGTRSSAANATRICYASATIVRRV